MPLGSTPSTTSTTTTTSSTATSTGAGHGAADVTTIAPPLRPIRFEPKSPMRDSVAVYALRDAVYAGMAKAQVNPNMTEEEVRQVLAQRIRYTEGRVRGLIRIYGQSRRVLGPLKFTVDDLMQLVNSRDCTYDLSQTLIKAGAAFASAAGLAESDIVQLCQVTREQLQQFAFGTDPDALEAQSLLDILNNITEEQQAKIDDNKKARDKAYAAGLGDRQDFEAQLQKRNEEVQILRAELAELRRQVTLGTASATDSTTPTPPAGRRGTTR